MSSLIGGFYCLSKTPKHVETSLQREDLRSSKKVMDFEEQPEKGQSDYGSVTGDKSE